MSIIPCLGLNLCAKQVMILVRRLCNLCLWLLMAPVKLTGTVQLNFIFCFLYKDYLAYGVLKVNLKVCCRVFMLLLVKEA